jgi:NitT/TauT family transport system substrate-binding protein
VELLTSPDPARTAAALRNGEIDAMWGGPLLVMLTHASDPAGDSVCCWM